MYVLVLENYLLQVVSYVGSRFGKTFNSTLNVDDFNSNFNFFYAACDEKDKYERYYL